MSQQQFQLCRPATLSRRALNMEHKIPYVDVISDAILSSPYRKLTAKEIFEQVSAKYGSMKKAETLKNTIRHTLSRYTVFRKVQRGRQKKPNWWTVDEKILYSVGSGQQSGQWYSDSNISISDHQQIIQQDQPINYTPPSNKSFLFNANINHIHHNDTKLTSAFCGYKKQDDAGYFGWFGHPANVRNGGTAGSSFQRPMFDNHVNGGDYVITVEDFTGPAITTAGTAMLPTHPALSFN